jgi:hypothetical protein
MAPSLECNGVYPVYKIAHLFFHIAFLRQKTPVGMTV